MSNLLWNIVGRALLPALFFAWVLRLGWCILGVSFPAVLWHPGTDWLVAILAWIIGVQVTYSIVAVELAASAPPQAVRAVFIHLFTCYLVGTIAAIIVLVLQPCSWFRIASAVAAFLGLFLTEFVIKYWGGSDSGTVKSPRIR